MSNVVPLAGLPPDARVPNGGESQSVRKICALPGVVPGWIFMPVSVSVLTTDVGAFWIDTFSRELGPAGPVSIVTPLTPSPPTPPVVADVGTDAHTMLGAELLLLNEVSRQTSLAVPGGTERVSDRLADHQRRDRDRRRRQGDRRAHRATGQRDRR